MERKLFEQAFEQGVRSAYGILQKQAGLGSTLTKGFGAVTTGLGKAKTGIVNSMGEAKDLYSLSSTGTKIGAGATLAGTAALGVGVGKAMQPNQPQGLGTRLGSQFDNKVNQFGQRIG